MEKRAKRYYNVGEMVWVVGLKKEGKVESINKESLEVTVTVKSGVNLLDKKTDEVLNEGLSEVTVKIWEIDKLKYSAKEKLIKTKQLKKNKKTTYLASVNGGVIPTKDTENAGRDCYARLEPQIRDGVEVIELYIPRWTLAKIPLGFASYLEIDDVLSLKHERSSIGSTGMINVSGLIDSTYQGEVILQVIPLTSDIVITNKIENKFFDEETNTYFIPYDKAIAQAVVFKLSDAEDTHISYDELLDKPSKRGKGGFGSTGK